jgi:tryptophan-rich sensory protein
MACELVGASGAIFNVTAIPTWYATLTRPSLAPPNWIFGPVWTSLFLLMGIALWLVWDGGVKRREVRIALWLFVWQFALNVLWSALFFGLRNPGAALIEIIVLWGSIVATIMAFRKVSWPAAWLLAPYLLWVSFAAYLNAAFWWLNR